MTDLKKVVDQLSKLTVMEAAELAKMLEDEWGVSAAAPVAVAAAPAAAGDAAAGDDDEPDTVTIVLTGAGDKKINVIKRGARHYRIGTQRSQRTGGICSQAPQRRCQKGGSRRDQKTLGRSRRNGGTQVMVFFPSFSRLVIHAGCSFLHPFNCKGNG